MLRVASGAACLILSLCCFAQIEFNRRYDSFEQLQVQEGWAIELRGDSGFTAVHMSRVLSGSEEYLVTSLVVLDALGNVDTLSRVPLDTLIPGIYCGWTNSSDITDAGDIVIGGSTSDLDGVHMAALIRFHPSGAYDTMYTYLPEGTVFIGRQAKQTPDGSFVLTGSRSLNGNTDGFLIKTDANGAQEWVQTYGGTSYDEFVAVDMVPGGGYYLGGYSFVPGSNYQHWALCVDGLGGIIWNITWGGTYTDPAAHLMTSSDGHAVIASGLRYNSTNGPAHLYMAKLDSTDGSFLWQHTYSAPTINTTLFAVKEVQPFGDLIATGQAYDANGEVGVLVRTTSTGDSLWMRYYNYHDALVDSGDAQLRDVLPTPDGGFIAVGVAFGIGPYSQDVWVVKTDSMGCIEPGCHLIQGMQTQITNLRDALTVAPNPVVQGGSVQVHLELPENFTPQGALRLTLVSSDGRVVHEKVIAVTGHSARSEGVPLSLDRTRMPAGLYHLHVSDDTRWISGAKLVVE